MTESAEERARRLGLTASPQQRETAAERAARLGLDTTGTGKAAKPDVRRALGMRDTTARADVTDTSNRALRSSRGEKVVGTEGQQIFGGIAALGRDIPGIEALQAGSRALVRTGLNKVLPDRIAPEAESYREALENIRLGEESAPTAVRAYNRLAGGSVAAAAIPTKVSVAGKALRVSSAGQGAAYGAAHALANADPDQGVRDRAVGATLESLFGAAGAKVGDAVGTGVKALASRPLGKTALRRTAALREADERLYGSAYAEAIERGSTSPEIKAALASKDIAPYVDELRNTREFANVDDATMLREVYKHMSERQRLLRGRSSPENYRAGTDLEQREIGAAKDDLLRAADPVMPNFRTAVNTHAQLAGEREAFRTGADNGRRLIRNTQPAGKNLATQTPEAIRASIPRMTPGQATATREGMLGSLKSSMKFGPETNLMTGFGASKLLGGVPMAVQGNRLAPYINLLEEQAGISSPLNAIRSVAPVAGAELAEALRRVRW